MMLETQPQTLSAIAFEVLSCCPSDLEGGVTYIAYYLYIV